MIIGFEVVAGLIVFAYALYIVFFLLFKVIQGNLKVLKERGEQRAKITDEEYDVTPNAQLGLTMADGGDQVEKNRDEKKDLIAFDTKQGGTHG